jgi:hypothetical protein
MKVKVFETGALTEIPFDNMIDAQEWLHSMGLDSCAFCGVVSRRPCACPWCHDHIVNNLQDKAHQFPPATAAMDARTLIYG